MKNKTTELPNYNTKTSTGRIKAKKSRRYANEDLHVCDSYKDDIKFGIKSLVEDALNADADEFEDELNQCGDEELDIFGDYYPNDDENDYTYGYN
jgi:hypothetical protein